MSLSCPIHSFLWGSMKDAHEPLRACSMRQILESPSYFYTEEPPCKYGKQTPDHALSGFYGLGHLTSQSPHAKKGHFTFHILAFSRVPNYNIVTICISVDPEPFWDPLSSCSYRYLKVKPQ